MSELSEELISALCKAILTRLLMSKRSNRKLGLNVSCRTYDFAIVESYAQSDRQGHE